MEEIINKLIEFKSHNDVELPVNLDEIKDFELENNLQLPFELKKIYQKFDGGEILIPGPQIFGLRNSKKRENLKEANSRKIRNNFSIPKNYLIIAKLNYGDYICINLNKPFDIIQWDHESDQPFCTWNSLKEWLNDNIDSFEKFEDQTS